MFYLLATILTNTILFALFKLFPRYKIDNLQAIVANYFTCVIVGSFLLGRFPVSMESINKPWFGWAILMGIMFFSLFNLIAYRTREDGMTTTTIANKLSLIIPVMFSSYLYADVIGVGKIAGILLAFPAIYFTAHANDNGARNKSHIFPAILFVGSGLLDTLVKYVEYNFLATATDLADYVVHVFFTAGIVGAVVVAVLQLKNGFKIRGRNLVAGIILGVPNYFSIYFLIKLLHSDFLQSSAAIPVNNIGIVLLSAITGIFLFKEHATWQRILGLILSIASIFLIAFSDIYGRV